MQPPSSNPSHPVPTALERAAADWLALIDRGMTPAQEFEFERWLAADARHAGLFGEIDGTWTLLDRIPETRVAVAAAAKGGRDPDVFAPARARSTPAGISPDSGMTCDQCQAEIDHRSRRQGSSVFGRRGTLRWLSPVVAVAAVLAMACLGWWRPAHRAPHYAAAVATEIGGLRKLDLPDGSVVSLNTDSALEIGFTASERRVRLTRGEAHFEVSKDQTRPFVVRAGGVDVQAVGTAFGVRLRTTSVDVLVTEGQVRVDDAAQGRSLLADQAGLGPKHPGGAPFTDSPPVLVAGQKVTIPLAPQAAVAPLSAAPVSVPRVEIERAMAWRSQRLEFASAPLAEVVVEINRYNRHQLVIDDVRLAGEHLGGSFRANDLAGFVRLLETNFNVIVEQRENETVLRLAP